MPERILQTLAPLDAALAGYAAALLLPLALYICLSGLDDLLIDLLWFRRLLRPAAPLPPAAPEAPLAILLPLWHEAGVVGAMLDHNLAAIKYSNYEVFAGYYPNDPATARALRAAAARHPRLHLAEVPHPGPTSKGDCLNWIFQRLLLHEEQLGRRFEILVLHDAEDLIHPLSLERINRYTAAGFDMVQMPVLALRTPLRELTHGLYCDDFAESQGKDLVSRVEAGGFLPGCGVGTGFRRQALDLLAEHEGNRLFHPGALTEDYDNGLRLFALGCRQIFVPLEFDASGPVATREYFPRDRRGAIRQRTRWVMGNALQAWRLFGWGRSLPDAAIQRWFFWRDRKGLWGNAASLVCNLLLLYGLASWTTSRTQGVAWPLAERLQHHPAFLALLWINAALLLERLAVRIAASARLYGLPFALGVPLRMLWGNWINFRAVSAALWRDLHERSCPAWLKTDHAYPSLDTLRQHKRRLGEILVSDGYCEATHVEHALKTQPPGLLLGEYMIRQGVLTETTLYEALSLQQSLPCLNTPPGQVETRVLRALPEGVADEWQVLPFRVEEGALLVAGPRVPDDRMQQELQRFSSLQLRFHLIAPSEFERWRSRLRAG